MKPYVDVQGSGEGVTRLVGRGHGPDEATLVTAPFAELRDLTVEDQGGGPAAVAVRNDAGAALSKVTLRASGADASGTSGAGIALHGRNGASGVVQGSVLRGATWAVKLEGGADLFVGASQLAGGIESPSPGALPCVASFDAGHDPLDAFCRPTGACLDADGDGFFSRAGCGTATAAGTNNNEGNGFTAFLSSSTSNVFSRLVNNPRGWMRMDNRPVFDSQAEIQVGQIWHPINRNEFGQVVTTDIYVATGTNGNGTTASNTCMDWSSGTGFGAFGNLNNGRVGWIQESNFGCSFVLRLHCLGRGKTPPLNPAPFGGTAKYVFVTAATLAPNASSGPAEFDALCNAEKPVGSGTFRAWMATTGVAATSLLVGTTDYQRIERQLIGTGAEIATSAQFANGAGMRQHSNLTFPAGFQRVYTGSTSPSSAGTDVQDCTNWGSSAGTGISGLYQVQDSRWWSFTPIACNTPAHVHCLEQ